MANCHKLFLLFNDSISLGVNHKNSLRKSRDAIRDKIKKYFRDKKNGFAPKFHGQGSFMMNTIIAPLDGEFDIDDGIYFKVETEPTQDVKTFHRWIYEAVDGHTKHKPIDKQTCIRLVYAGEYHIDLPIYYIVGEQTPHLAHKGKGWIESDPREFIDWFRDKADKNGQLKRIIRYLKAWSDYRKGQLPSGLVFSILAARHIIFDERDDIALYNTLLSIQYCLQTRFACERPTIPVGENLLEEYSKTNKSYFLDRLDSFIKSSEEALDDSTNQTAACKIWQRHFGDERFPDIPSLDSSFHVPGSLLSPGIGLNRPKAIAFDDTEEFIENYFPTSLRYCLKIDCRVSQNGYLTRSLAEMLFKKFPLFPGKKLEFYISSCDVPKPFSVKWKVRNVGEDAKQRNQIRGQILNDQGKFRRIESSNFNGPHFVECYIIKNNRCVARDRIDVPITSS